MNDCVWYHVHDRCDGKAYLTFDSFDLDFGSHRVFSPGLLVARDKGWKIGQKAYFDEREQHPVEV